MAYAYHYKCSNAMIPPKVGVYAPSCKWRKAPLCPSISAKYSAIRKPIVAQTTVIVSTWKMVIASMQITLAMSVVSIITRVNRILCRYACFSNIRTTVFRKLHFSLVATYKRVKSCGKFENLYLYFLMQNSNDFSNSFDYGDTFWLFKNRHLSCKCLTAACRYASSKPDGADAAPTTNTTLLPTTSVSLGALQQASEVASNSSLRNGHAA